jgi:hypothetical protein
MLLAAAIAGLLVARWITPTEAAPLGETLWLAPLWLLAAAAVCMMPGHRRPLTDRWSITLLACVALLVIAHGVSAVVADGSPFAWLPETRYRIVEWLTVGLSIGAIVFASRVDEGLPRVIVQALLGVGVTVSVLGIYQHHVWYPQIAAEYGTKLDRLRDLESAGGDTAALRRELAAAGIPTDGSSRWLFADRLRESREPFGFFALANTLGGHLAAVFVLGCGLLATARPIRRVVVPFGLLLLPIGYTLWLTQSRTAIVGAVAGCAILALRLTIERRSAANSNAFTSPIWLRWGAVALVAAMVVVFSPLTPIDWDHWTDADRLPGPLKSLQYRFQYWAASQDLLAKHWGFGVGPGGFRAAYLLEKRPEASEEIADPHNLFFDLHANAGLLGLVVFVGLLGLLAWGRPAGKNEESKPTSQPDRRAALFGGLAAFGVVFAVLMLRDGAWDDRYLILAPVGGLATWLAGKCLESVDLRTLRMIAGAAAIAMVIHLLAAGGIETPAVGELLFLLMALAFIGAVSVKTETVERRRSSLILPAGLSVAAFVVGVMIVRPQWQAAYLLGHARQQSAIGNLDRAAALTEEAGHWEPNEPTALELRAAVAFARWQRLGQANDFAEAIDGQRRAVQLEPAAPSGWARLGEFFAAKAAKDDDRAAAVEAVAAFQEASRRHPTSARLWADLAFAARLANDVELARTAAERALAQQSTNEICYHLDQLLDAETVGRLKMLANGKP